MIKPNQGQVARGFPSQVSRVRAPSSALDPGVRSSMSARSTDRRFPLPSFAVAVAIGAALAGCGGGPIVEQDESLEVGGIEYRVLRTRVLGTEATVLPMTVRATNLTGAPRDVHGAEGSPLVFVVLSDGKRIETAGAPRRGRLDASETITFTLTAEVVSRKDLALELLGSSRYPLSGNQGRIDLRDL